MDLWTIDLGINGNEDGLCIVFYNDKVLKKGSYSQCKAFISKADKPINGIQLTLF